MLQFLRCVISLSRNTLLGVHGKLKHVLCFRAFSPRRRRALSAFFTLRQASAFCGDDWIQPRPGPSERLKNRFVALSDEDWNSFACVNGLGWFVRWHLPVEHDRARHSEQVSTGGRIPMGPTIFRRVPTVACEVLNPLMSSLLEKGFDIEWYIIVVGKRELSDSNQKLYERLCRATRGQFLSIGTGGWNENKDETARFLEAVEDSGYDISERDRRHRQQQYQR